MLMREERELVRDYGHKLIEAGLTTGTGGNISIFNREKGLMAIKPSGIEYVKIRAEDVAVLDLEGNQLEGAAPSSEYEMHAIFYRNRADVNAIVHTHSTYATTIACLNWEIPSLHYLVAFAGEKVPCAPYATFGTKELAENAYKAMNTKYNAALLANHGLLVVGSDIASAFAATEQIEFCAELLYRTKCIGDPVLLPLEEMERVAGKFQTYGQTALR
ncbi:L-fuculose-phosphate aldolase [Candidatus Darwinibacter acetoxidans]|nr:L-fuculose-phosphate aldolase [Bacillota bacterium]HAI53116.1 fuculose phosphate aldolase [Bacillota bacterium]